MTMSVQQMSALTRAIGMLYVAMNQKLMIPSAVKMAPAKMAFASKLNVLLALTVVMATPAPWTPV
jgi:hypothetical protein